MRFKIHYSIPLSKIYLLGKARLAEKIMFNMGTGNAEVETRKPQVILENEGEVEIMLKKLLSLALIAVMVMEMGTTAIASSTNVSRKNVTIEGITYTIDECYEGDTKVVSVSGNGTHNVVSLSGNTMEIANDTGTVNFTIDKTQSSNSQTMPRSSDSKKSLWWNYGYYYSDSSINNYGMYFRMDSGDTYGSWSGFDYKNKDARDLAYAFCAEVRNLDSQQWAASAASGVSGGSIAAAIASAGPTAGIGAVIGIVAALLSGGVAVAEWVASYNSSLDCNQLFTQFKQAL